MIAIFHLIMALPDLWIIMRLLTLKMISNYPEAVFNKQDFSKIAHPQRIVSVMRSEEIIKYFRCFPFNNFWLGQIRPFAKSRTASIRSPVLSQGNAVHQRDIFYPRIFPEWKIFFFVFDLVIGQNLMSIGISHNSQHIAVLMIGLLF